MRFCKHAIFASWALALIYGCCPSLALAQEGVPMPTHALGVGVGNLKGGLNPVLHYHASISNHRWVGEFSVRSQEDEDYDFGDSHVAQYTGTLGYQYVLRMKQESLLSGFVGTGAGYSDTYLDAKYREERATQAVWDSIQTVSQTDLVFEHRARSQKTFLYAEFGVSVHPVGMPIQMQVSARRVSDLREKDSFRRKDLVPISEVRKQIHDFWKIQKELNQLQITLIYLF